MTDEKKYTSEFLELAHVASTWDFATPLDLAFWFYQQGMQNHYAPIPSDIAIVEMFKECGQEYQYLPSIHKHCHDPFGEETKFFFKGYQLRHFIERIYGYAGIKVNKK